MSAIASCSTRLLTGALLCALLFQPAAIASTKPLHRNPQASTLSTPTYALSVFARGTSAYFNPDSITTGGGYLYVAYTNATKPDGSDHAFSTVVQYTRSGGFVHAYSILGHCDGLRYNPYTGLVWALVNQDANPYMYTINPGARIITPYRFSSVPHGGGFDDLAFTNGKALISASNPTLNGAGVNTHPAVDSVRLVGNIAQITPVLRGNATALDVTTNKTVTLNLVDPDSMSVDPSGVVVMANQAGRELIYLHNPGTSAQRVTRLPVGTEVDDTVFVTSTLGCLYIVDGKTNTTYRTSGSFVPGTAFTEAPSDAIVASFVGTLDQSTGQITPVIIGLRSPTGLLFVP